MNWDKVKLRKFLDLYRITYKELELRTGISRDQVRKMIEIGKGFDIHGEVLTAYLEAQKEAKRKELECMMQFYQSFS